MTNFDIKERAREIVEMITAKLAPDLMSSRFDKPIAEAAGEFECEVEYPVTHKEFHKIIANFVQQIYEKALKASWVLTNPLDEAILLLENGYHSYLYGPGYTGAILHTNDTEKGGIQAVLAGLAGAINDIERKKYIDGVLTWHLHGCSWELQCEIAEVILDDYRAFIPPQLCKCVPAQLVDVIPTIIQRYIDSDFTLQGISFLGNL
ncbi:MAG: hypothetical protein AMJ75_02625 [Phycisphaerae bacterium SM1_79]|nr:MAG: hypothetical protein AMJ75_02625 [Phycisphaerae bacterium SM1_79]